MQWRSLRFALYAVLIGIGVWMCRTPGPAPSQGQLAPCPSSPNCVSSQAPVEDTLHWIAPLAAHGDARGRCERLFAVTSRVPGAGKGMIRGEELRFAFHTRLFTDDVDLICREDRIDVRSASRMGYGDLGVNRQRIEAIRAAWDAAEAATTPESGQTP